MNKFYVIANSGKDIDGAFSRKIADYIRKNGKECVLNEEGPLAEDVDCILVLGGDGTLLRAAREMQDYDIPLLGINLGTLGYLAEIDKDSVFSALDKLFADEYSMEYRMMIQGTIYHDGKAVYTDIALNDIVIIREGPLRVVHFKNYVNDAFLNEYKADGIIISTATGSTGYNMSAGGPIVSPEASLMVMTPLAAHALNTRSIIFSAGDKITVELGPGRTGEQDTASACYDGGVSRSVVTGDYIVIECAGQKTKLVKINNISFLEVLRTKMKNG